MDEITPPWQKCLLHPQFWLIVGMATMSMMFGITSLDIYKVYAITQPTLNHEGYLTLISSVNSLFSSLRFIWSWALDNHSYKRVYGALLLLQIFLSSTFILAAKVRALYALWVWLSLFCEAAHFVLLPNILKKIYGK